MARMAQEGIPPGCQGTPPSRPLRAPPPAPGAPVGRQGCGAGHQQPPRARSASAGRPEPAAGLPGAAPPAESSRRPCSAGTRGGLPSAGPRRRAYLCPRLGSSSLALPQPGLR